MPTSWVALALATKSAGAAAPGSDHNKFGWNRAKNVASPSTAGAPVLLPGMPESGFSPAPSPQSRNTRCRLKREGCDEIVLTTVRVSVACWRVALDGMSAARANRKRARLVKPLAFAPEASVDSAPRLLFGLCSNKVVSATG